MIEEKLKIYFLGDYEHPNAQSWIEGLENTGRCEIIKWQLPQNVVGVAKLYRMSALAASIFTIKRNIKIIKPDLIICYRITSYGLIGTLSGFHPIVLAMQGAWDIWPLDSWTTKIKKKIANFIVKRADMIHTWGKHMKANCETLGADPNKILMLPRGIDLDIFYPPKELRPINPIKIIITRSLKTEYNHSLILRAAAQLIKENIQLNVIIVGDGYLKETLINEAKELNISSNVVFTGRINNKELPALLRDSNVYISMPDTEGVSASLFEAMATGCFPIVTDHEANRSWIEDGRNGFLIKKGDLKGLVSAIKKLTVNPDTYINAINSNFTLVNKKSNREKNISIFVDNYFRLVYTNNKEIIE